MIDATSHRFSHTNCKMLIAKSLCMSRLSFATCKGYAARTSLLHWLFCSVQMMTLPSCPALAMVFMGIPKLGAQATSLTQSEWPLKASPCWTHCRLVSSSCHICTVHGLLNWQTQSTPPAVRVMCAIGARLTDKFVFSIHDT